MMKQEDRLLTTDEIVIAFMKNSDDLGGKLGDIILPVTQAGYAEVVSKVQDTKSIKLRDKEWMGEIDKKIKDCWLVLKRLEPPEEYIASRSYIKGGIKALSEIKSKMGVSDE